jgi:hypothetical protein
MVADLLERRIGWFLRPHELAVARLTMTTLVALVMLGLAVRQKLPRTQRYRPDGTVPAAAGA